MHRGGLEASAARHARHAALSSAALQHVLTVQDAPEVQRLMQRCGAPDLLSSFRRFPGLLRIVAALVSAREATPENLTLLFGAPENAEGVLEELRGMATAPLGSPAATIWAALQPATSPRLDPRHVVFEAARAAAASDRDPASAVGVAAAAPPVWATASELKPCAGGFGCAQPGTLRCGACSGASYCSAQCQRRDWPAHKPACLRLRADAPREPSARALAAAAEAEAARHADQHARLERQRAACEAADRVWAELDCETFRPAWLHTCEGERRRSTLAAGCALQLSAAAAACGLEKEISTTNFGPLPPGVEAESGRGFYLRSLPQHVAAVSGPDGGRQGGDSGLHLLVLVERLFADGGEGALIAHELEGLFVARGPVAAEGPDQVALFHMSFRRVAPVINAVTGAVDVAASVRAMVAAAQ